MALVTGGAVVVGHDGGPAESKPQLTVVIDSFYMDVTEVTVGQFERYRKVLKEEKGRNVVGEPANVSSPHQEPVLGVSLTQAQFYAKWAGEEIPTEAEWERAARGGVEGQPYSWGNTPPEDLPDYASRWKTGPETVGLYAPNPYGLFNMGDNVHEWCADWYDADYYERSPERNPQGPERGSRRASRGGAWRHHIKVSRCAARSSIPPEFNYADYGFRVARSV